MPPTASGFEYISTTFFDFNKKAYCVVILLLSIKMTKKVALLNGWDDAIVEFWEMTKSFLEFYNSLTKRLNSLIIPSSALIPSGISIVI